MRETYSRINVFVITPIALMASFQLLMRMRILVMLILEMRINV